MARPVVLILIKGLGIGGAERLISEGSRHWDRERFDYRVAYFLGWKDQLVAPLEAAGVPVDLLGSGRRVGPGGMGALRRFVRREDVSLIHAHLPLAGIVARLGSKVPLVYTEHNVVTSYRPFSRVLNRLTYRMNTQTIAVSEAVARSVANYPGRPVRVIENGVSVSANPDDVDTIRRSLGMGRKLVVHVGNIRPHKGHATLLEAAKLLRSWRDDFVLVSAGGEKYPGDLERLKGEIERLDLNDCVRMLGRRTDSVDLLGAADVVVNPSDVEGLPLALLEAMALRRPVVATSVGGVPDIVIDGQTGLLVPPRDPAAMASSLSRLLDDPDFGIELGENAAKLVSEAYGLEQMVRTVEKVYEGILGDESRPGG